MIKLKNMTTETNNKRTTTTLLPMVIVNNSSKLVPSDNTNSSVNETLSNIPAVEKYITSKMKTRFFQSLSGHMPITSRAGKYPINKIVEAICNSSMIKWRSCKFKRPKRNLAIRLGFSTMRFST